MRKRNKFLKTLLLFPFVFIEFILRKCVPPYRNLPLLFQRTISALLIFTILALNFNFLNILFVPKAQAAWYDDSWTYRKAITVTVTTNASDITNLQTLLTVDANALGSSKLQTNCQDLRFTNANGKLLDYYIDTCTNSTAASKVWVMLDLVPKNTTTYTVYMYYGNPTAAAATNAGKFDNVVGLKGYWSMNDGGASATATDSSISANNGTLSATPAGSNTTATAMWTQGATGKYAASLGFDGTDDYVSAAASTALINQSAGTLSMWVNPTSFSNNSTPTMFDVGGFYWLVSNSSGVLSWYGGNSSPLTGPTISTSSWTHVVVTWGNSERKIYINGSAVASDTTVANNAPGATAGIGARNNGSTPYNGLIDDVKVYNTARTATQIAADYANTSCGGQTCNIATTAVGTITPSTSFATEEKGTTPIAYWKLDDGTGTTAQDATSSNFDGTVTNATWQSEDQCISGKCLKFDGTGDYVSTGSRAGPAAFSVSMWVRPNSFAATQVLAAQYNGVNAYFQYFVDTSGFMTFRIHQSIDTIYIGRITATSLDLNSWQYVTATWDGTTTSAGVKIYKNGIQIDSSNSQAGTFTAPNSSSIDWQIGAQNGGSSANGFIDDVKSYNFALTAAQIKANYVAKSSAEGGSNLSSSSLTGGSISNGLAGYWKMDEAAANSCTGGVNDSCDSSGNAKDGAWAGTNIGATTGKFGNAANFNGTDDKITAASTTVGTTMTIAGWIKKTASTGQKSFFSNRGSGNVYFGLAGTSVYMYDNGGTPAGALSSTGAITTGQWQHVVATNDGTTTIFYVNGVALPSISQTRSSSTGTIGIGWDPTIGTEYWDGQIDEIRLYNRALSPNEVSQLYNFAPGPVVYYKFDEGTGTTSVNDSSGNGYTATMTGTMTESDWVTGKYGKALDFDGTDDYVSNNSFSWTTGGPVTVSYWVYTPGGTTGASFGVGNTGSSVNRLMAHSPWNDNNLYWDYGNTGTTGRISTSFASYLNRWTHVSLVSQGNNGAFKGIYLNGVLVTSAASSDGPDATITALTVGRTNDGAWFHNGKIDDFKIYNYQRTAGQIVEDMNAGHPAPGSPISSAIGHWRFDEGADNTCTSGGTTDTCNSGNAGSTLNGSNTSTAWTQAGKFGKALTYNGSTSYTTIPASSTLNFGAGGITYSTWAKATSLPGASNFILDRTTASIPLIDLYVNSTGTVACQMRGTNSSLVASTSTTSIATGTWYHLACVRDPGSDNFYTYINGVLSATSNDTSDTVDLTSVSLEIGNYQNGTASAWNGQIDEFKIYNSALTADQIKLDMNRGSSQVLGALSDNTSYEKQAANQEYCVPGDSTSCAAPVGRWDFNEASGTTANDSSGNANTGTWQGTTTDIWKPGKYGKAGNFNGTDNLVSAGNASSLQLSTGTAEAWIKTSNAGTTYRAIVAKENAYGLYLKDNVLILYDWNTASDRTTSVNLGDNTWYHVVATFQSGTTNGTIIYINGVAKLTTTMTVVNQTSNLGFGARAVNSTQTFAGQIDQVQIFNYARTAAQIAWDYNRGAPVGHWRLDECQGTVANDASGNSNTGTITVGASGTYTSVGTCPVSSASSMWYNGATGKRNYSLAFDGTDDYVTIPSSSTLQFGTELTISSWFKTSSAAQRAIVSNRGSGVYFGMSGGVPFVYDQSCTAAAFFGIKTINDNTWHHMIFTRSGSATKIYIDGVLDASATQTGCAATTAIVNIGKDTPNAEYFPGQIDDVRIYNYALTLLQVKNLYNDGTVKFAPSTGAP